MSNLILILAWCFVALAQGHAAAADTASLDPSTTQYRPPSANPVPRRIGGSSRGVPPALPAVAALVPDHLGLTISEQPALYWYLSAPTDARIEIALIEPGREAPLLEVAVSGAAAGIHGFDLSAHGIRLRAGVEYEWFVALIVSSAQRARDIVSGGAIMRIDRSSDGLTTAAAFATNGLWYDALMAFDRDRTQTPADAAIRSQRAALLEQVGLAEVASFERR